MSQRLFARQLAESAVQPDRPAFGVQNGIRNLKIVHHAVFQVLILLGKADQIIDDRRAVFSEGKKSDQDINSRPAGGHYPRFYIDKQYSGSDCNK